MSIGPKPAEAAKLEWHSLEDDGRIPNNAACPLAVYRAALPLDGRDPAADCEALFARNNWGGGWRNGVYAHHHYHATSHEALGIVRGEAKVRFGGARGPVVAVRAGDVVVIPAGVGHRSEGASPDLLVVGAYPDGRAPDMWTEKSADRAEAMKRIRRVPIPSADPVYGSEGPLIERWRRGATSAPVSRK